MTNNMNRLMKIIRDTIQHEGIFNEDFVMRIEHDIYDAIEADDKLYDAIWSDEP